MSILAIENVTVRYLDRGRHFTAVDDVSLTLQSGEVLALIGESGSGKSTLARAIVGLTPMAFGRVTLDDRPIPRHGRRPVGIVFQDSLGSLDSRMTVERAIREVLRVHRLRPREGERARVEELLALVGLPFTVAALKASALSGGQQQRVAIARALAAEPQMLVLDEPVSALDVSVRAQVLKLLDDLRTRLGIGMLFIGHDLAVVRQLADRVAVMYRGVLVEVGESEAFFAAPTQPYSRELLASVPSIRIAARAE